MFIAVLTLTVTVSDLYSSGKKYPAPDRLILLPLSLSLRCDPPA